jgi:hypothetical protein
VSKLRRVRPPQPLDLPLYCGRCGKQWDGASFRFSAVTCSVPLCTECYDDVVESARSWGSDYAEFATQVRRRLAAMGHNVTPHPRHTQKRPDEHSRADAGR